MKLRILSLSLIQTGKHMENGSIEKLKTITIKKNEVVLTALKRMDELGVKLLIVIDDDKFCSLISIGDIQRAIIKNTPLDTEINHILRENVRVSYDYEDFEEIKQRMLKFRTECMPVIDKDKNIVDVYFWEDVFLDKRIEKELNVPVVIMAGGRGSRLKPITNIIPKPLVPLGEKPIMEHIIDNFSKLGCKQFYVSVNYKHEMIKYYFDQLEDKDYELIYVMETEPLGTAGSLMFLQDKIKSTFFVTNCDILVYQDYRDIYDYHVENKNDLTVVASLKHYKIPYGTLETGEDGMLVDIKEKPELTFVINTGMYILEPQLILEIPENTIFHITDLIAKIKKKSGKVGVFPVSQKSWVDIGEWNEYHQTLKDFEQRFKP